MEARIVNISGKIARVLPYSEKRRKALLEVATEVEAYINEADTIDPKKRAEFWRRKSEILLEFMEGNPTIEFYLSEEYESGVLAWVEQDFIRQRLYL